MTTALTHLETELREFADKLDVEWGQRERERGVKDDHGKMFSLALYYTLPALNNDNTSIVL